MVCTSIKNDQEKLPYIDFKKYVVELLKFEDIMHSGKGYHFVEALKDWEVILQAWYNDFSEITEDDVIRSKDVFVDFVVFAQKVNHEIADTNMKEIGKYLMTQPSIVIDDCTHDKICFKNLDTGVSICISLLHRIDTIKTFIHYLSKTPKF